MEGVEIIAVKEVVMNFPITLITRGLEILFLFGFVTMIMLIILAVLDGCCIDIGWPATPLVCFMALMLIFAEAWNVTATIDACEKETLYDIIVFDDVSFNELNEHYEIVEQNGRILTVRERK